MAGVLNQFQKTMEDHLVHFKESFQFLPATNSKKKWQYYDFADNLFPPIKHAFLQYAYDTAIPFHDYFNHVRSSQIFGINLFYPLLRNEPEVILGCLSNAVGIQQTELSQYYFEHSPETNLLGEWKSDDTRPDEYVTATDLAITTKDISGSKNVFLLEVKFTEEAFSKCGGYDSSGNKSKEICENRAEVFKDKSLCYLQNRTRGKSARIYFDLFDDLEQDFPGQPEIKGCPFRENHQCLRNHAFARALRQESGNEIKTYFGLAYHDDNLEIQDQWHKYLQLVSERLRTELFSIKASNFLKCSKNITLKSYFEKRYLLR